MSPPPPFPQYYGDTHGIDILADVADDYAGGWRNYLAALLAAPTRDYEAVVASSWGGSNS